MGRNGMRLHLGYVGAPMTTERTMTPSDLDFDDWVLRHAEDIAEARRVSVASLGTEPGEIAAQLTHARRYFIQMGLLLQDATSWVLKSHAVATQETRNKWPEMTADERRVMTKADPSYLCALKVQGDLEITVSALKSLHFEILNGRRATFNPQAHNDD